MFFNWMNLVRRRDREGLKANDTDRLGEAHHAMLLPGRVVLNDACAYPCTIKNTAPGGAMIEMEEQAYVPPGFRLEFPEQDISVECRRAWQKDRRVGVRFKNALVTELLCPPPPDEGDMAGRQEMLPAMPDEALDDEEMI